MLFFGIRNILRDGAGKKCIGKVNIVRKKSHISLAGFLADKLEHEGVKSHRKAFCLGSILPDCMPSFLTTKHAFNETFEMLQKRIENYIEYSATKDKHTMKAARDLGQIIHYTADYFTFPHNKHYDGNLKDHCVYEKKLLLALKEYLNNYDVTKHTEYEIYFESLDELIEFIKERHKEYVSRKRNVEDDCRFIVMVNYQITRGIMQLLEERKQSLVYAM